MHHFARALTVLGLFSICVACAATGGTGTAPAPAGESDLSALAKESQNPLTAMYTLPLQNNTSFGIGPHDRTANVTNIQPVIPVPVDDWMLINRTIFPVVYAPYPQETDGGVWGMGDINYTGWFSPPSKGVIWGVGPILSFPTATDDILGSGKWSAGPSVVVLSMSGPWVIGGLANNLWSFAGDSDRDSVNQMLVQPFVNYNLDDGWFLTSGPIITADWTEDQSDRWMVPLGGGVGKVFNIGGQPMNCNVQAFKNVVKPDGGADWSLRIQLTFLFPQAPSVPDEK